jgi:uncharacterized spore protein YtfJ
MGELKDRILGLATRFGHQKHTIDYLGVEVLIKPISISVASKMPGYVSAGGGTLAGAKLIIACVINEDGTTVFSDDDTEALLQWPAEVFKALLEKVQDVCGMNDKAIEDAGKNLPATP